ncbi:hypothetical protein [Psychrobacillus sp. BM2]|uniref:hypothetical protein n=1 Tax=Psychrobacillus sp. BM2 TaxID=3400421 RepID=UPI003B01D2FF
MLHFVQNERGVFLPAVVILLLIVTVFLLSITAAYQAKYQTYDALEMFYTGAAIEKMEVLHRQIMR